VSNETTHSRPAIPESSAFALSVVAAILWGTNFEATRIILEQVGPWTAAAGRFVVAALAIMAWLALTQGINTKVLRANAFRFLILGMIGVAGFNAALFLGLQTSSTITGALIMGTSPLTTNLLDALFQRRPPRLVAVIGMGISLVGVALTIGAFAGTRFASGDVLILLGTFAWAVYTIGCRGWVRNASPLETSAWTMVFGALGLILMAFWAEAPASAGAQAGMTTILAMLWMALPGTVLAYLFWQIGVAVRGAGATSVLFNLVPVSALLVAMGFGQMPHLSQIAGVAVAIFGVLLASGRLKPWWR